MKHSVKFYPDLKDLLKRLQLQITPQERKDNRARRVAGQSHAAAFPGIEKMRKVRVQFRNTSFDVHEP